jgi:hypothetical protein
LVPGALLATLALLGLCSTTGALPVLLTLLREGYAARGEQRKCGDARQQLVLLRPHCSYSFTIWVFCAFHPALKVLSRCDANADLLAKFLQTVRVIFVLAKEFVSEYLFT